MRRNELPIRPARGRQRAAAEAGRDIRETASRLESQPMLIPQGRDALRVSAIASTQARLQEHYTLDANPGRTL